MTPHPVENLSALIDGQLLADERKAVEDHLQTCAECRDVVGDMRALVAATASASAPPVPEGLLDRIVWRLRGVSPTVGGGAPTRRRRGIPLAAAGTMAAAMLLAAVLVLDGSLLTEDTGPAAIAERSRGELRGLGYVAGEADDEEKQVDGFSAISEDAKNKELGAREVVGKNESKPLFPTQAPMMERLPDPPLAQDHRQELQKGRDFAESPGTEPRRSRVSSEGMQSKAPIVVPENGRKKANQARTDPGREEEYRRNLEASGQVAGAAPSTTEAPANRRDQAHQSDQDELRERESRFAPDPDSVPPPKDGSAVSNDRLDIIGSDTAGRSAASEPPAPADASNSMEQTAAGAGTYRGAALVCGEIASIGMGGTGGTGGSGGAIVLRSEDPAASREGLLDLATRLGGLATVDSSVEPKSFADASGAGSSDAPVVPREEAEEAEKAAAPELTETDDAVGNRDVVHAVPFGRIWNVLVPASRWAELREGLTKLGGVAGIPLDYGLGGEKRTASKSSAGAPYANAPSGEPDGREQAVACVRLRILIEPVP